MASVKSLPPVSAEAGQEGGARSEGGGALLGICPQRACKGHAEPRRLGIGSFVAGVGAP